MAYHHVAIVTQDLAATHSFYTEVMGFTLARVETAPTPEAWFADGGPTAGWARHVFYDTGGGEFLAVWDLHDPDHLPLEFDPSLSRAMGLPPWTNHIAFAAPTLDVLAARRDHIVAAGVPVVEIDHGWCTSVYAEDPNGNTVEFCCTTGVVHDGAAAQRLVDPAPPLAPPPEPRFFVPGVAPTG
ncbi:MAG: VOC family protein [Actinomycetota bacterium]